VNTCRRWESTVRRLIYSCDRLGARAGRHQLGHLEFLRRKARRTVLIAAYGLSGCSELGSGARRPRNCVDTFEDLDGHAVVASEEVGGVPQRSADEHHHADQDRAISIARPLRLDSKPASPRRPGTMRLRAHLCKMLLSAMGRCGRGSPLRPIAEHHQGQQHG
jgi:hypothetical protein